MTTERLSKDEYYLNIAKEVSRKSTCFRRIIGAIIIRDDQIISTGYAGAPRKTKDSLEHGYCLRDKLKIPHGQRYELCRSVHAEQNAIIHAGRDRTLGATLYLSGVDAKTGDISGVEPCLLCAKMIINAGLTRIVVQKTGDSFVEYTMQNMIEKFEQTFKK